MPVQSHPLLERKDHSHAHVEPRLGIAALLHPRDDRLDRLPRVLGHQHDVRARGDRTLHGLARPELLQHAGHGHRIREDEATKAHLVAKQAREHRGRQRCGNAGRVEGREDAVEGHHRADACADRGTKGRQLHRVETRAADSDRRQREVRVDLGVAVPGKVLARGDDAVLLEAARDRNTEPRHQGGVLANRARRDDGILRVVVDVKHGPEHHVNAEGARLARRRASHLVGERAVARRAERHLQRKVGRAAQVDFVGHEVRPARPEADPRLIVRAHQQGQR